jgi:hypothetical protein
MLPITPNRALEETPIQGVEATNDSATEKRSPAESCKSVDRNESIFEEATRKYGVVVVLCGKSENS